MSKILTFGVYDYFHLGHLRLFKQCKQYGDYLIVAIQNSDYILKYKPDAVYIEGELLITYPIIRALRKKHIPVYIKHKMEFVTI